MVKKYKLYVRSIIKFINSMNTNSSRCRYLKRKLYCDDYIMNITILEIASRIDDKFFNSYSYSKT